MSYPTTTRTASPTATAWATVNSPLSNPVPSQYVPAGERYFSAIINGSSVKLYAECGTALELLAPGDELVVEQRNGRWKIARTQPPELLTILQQRQTTPPPVVPNYPPQVIVLPPAPSAQHAPANAPQTIAPEPAKSADVRELVEIFLELRAALPDVKEETHRAMSNTIYMARSRQLEEQNGF
jgi:hypothetical protein